MNDEAVASIQASVANGSEELKSTNPSAAIGNTNPGSATIMGSAESGPINGAGEVKSAEPTEKAKGEMQGGSQPVPISSWYPSWGWSSSTNASGPVQLESESLEVKITSEDPQVDVPPFVTRPEPTSAASSETHQGDTPSASTHPSLPINPISTSMEANWSGWASFFSSRTLELKSLGYRRRRLVQDVKRDDEDKMEIMDIDDDEDERRDVREGGLLKDSGRKEGGRSSPILIAKPMLKPPDSQDSQTSRIELQISDSTGNKEEQSVSKSPAKSILSSTPEKGSSRSNTPIPAIVPPSSSPSSRDSQALPKVPSVSRIISIRTTSPSPSKKSVSSQPPPPNLVLPTWEQIFNTAPRNIAPVTNKVERYVEDQTVGGELLGKTMRFVSGVLFSREARDGSLESEKQMKGKEREMGRNRDNDFNKWKEGRFREFGKELPKSWQIEEAGLESNTSPTTPMSHIPIFGLSSTKKGDLRSSNKGSQIGSSGIDEYESKSHSFGMDDVLRGCKRVVVIGIHGWFPGTFSIHISFE